jgi:hypothetical protein
MENVPFEPLVDRSKPVHFWAGETEQYRLKIRRFSSLPAEFTVQRVSFDRDLERYQRAAAFARTTEVSVPRPRRVSHENDEPRSAESLERSQRRAKTNVRLLVTELAPTALVTFTTRETMSLDSLMWCWQYFTRLLRDSSMDYEYVAIPERHPSNPDHLHLHVAYRGRTPYGVLRRFWHMALEARHGRKVRCILRGAESPGNIDVQNIKARDSIRRIRKIARYVSKYITKDLISEFNRRRYWPSKGIDLAAASVFWLDSLSQFDAVREACRMLGQWDEAAGLTEQKLFMPSDRVCWCAIDPDRTPPPPF